MFGMTPLMARLMSRNHVYSFFAALILVGLGWLLAPKSATSLENYFYDAAWSTRIGQESEERIAVVTIDEKSLADIGPWPWDREVIADLSNRLSEMGAAAQAFDIVFPEEKPGDEIWGEVLKKNKAIIGVLLESEGKSPIRSGELKNDTNTILCNSLISRSHGYLGVSPQLSGNAIGHITPHIDMDGAVRKMPPVICNDGLPYSSLALKVFMQVSGLRLNEVVPGDFWESHSNLHFKDDYRHEIALDKFGLSLLAFDLDPTNVIAFSASDVLNGRIPKNQLNGRIVFVGATAFSLGDVVPTPLSGETHGLFLHVQALRNYLDENTPRELGGTVLIVLVEMLALGLLMVVLSNYFKLTASVALAISIVTPVLIWVLHSQLLVSLAIYIPSTPAVLFILLFTAIHGMSVYATTRLERHRLLDNFKRYMPATIAEKIAFEMPSQVVEAERSKMTILFADIRNFSAFEEKRPPEETAALLHLFYVKSTQIIEMYGGVVHEFRGDSVLATWPASSESSKLAVSAARGIVSVVMAFLPQEPPGGLEPLAVGVGIEEGAVLLGSMGLQTRRSPTLLGDAVTMAIKIQMMTSDLAEDILIGKNAAASLKEEERSLCGSFILPGLVSPCDIFAVDSKDLASSSTDNSLLKLVK